MPERLQDRQVAELRATDLRVFKSAEQTGNGSSQNVAHTLGYTPSLVWIVPTKVATAGDTFVEGAHDATNLKATVSTGSKYIICAM